MPSSISKRSTSLGYGDKDFGVEKKKFVPGVGTYNFKSDINPEQNKQKSYSFGVSREVTFLVFLENVAEWSFRASSSFIETACT